MHRTHVACSVCKKYKDVQQQNWSESQITKYRTGRNEAICVECKEKGRTSYKKDEIQCHACKETKGRLGFRKNDLNDLQKKTKAGKHYTLICIACRDKEPALQKIFDSLDSRLCPRCLCDMYKHKDDCKIQYKPCLTEWDLEVFGCKPVQRDKYHTTDVAYYKRIGALRHEDKCRCESEC